MNINPSVDLCKAFDQLKEDLIRAKKVADGNDYKGHEHSAAFGQLSACVQHFLFANSDAKTMGEIMQSQTSGCNP